MNSYQKDKKSNVRFSVDLLAVNILLAKKVIYQKKNKKLHLMTILKYEFGSWSRLKPN